MEEPGGLQSMGSQRVGHVWATSLSLFTFLHWRRKWQPTPVFLPGESQGGGAWWEAIYGVAQSQTRLKWLSSSSSSSSRVGPLSNDCCPYKKRKQREGDSYEKTEPVLGVLLTQAKEGPGLPEAGRGGSPLQGSEEAWPCQHPDFRLVACRTAREHISAAVSHLVCGT